MLESEEQYRLLFDSNPLPMWVFDRESLAFLAVNDAAVRQYGYSREEFLAMTIRDIRPEEEIPALLEAISHATSNVGDSELWRHKKKDGTIIDVEITSHPLIFRGRQAKLLLANEVTERRRAEEKFAKAFQYSPLPISITTIADERYVDVNEAFLTNFGYTREQVIGNASSRLRLWVDPDDRAALIRLLSSSGRVSSFETKFRHRGGNVRLMRLSAEPIELGAVPCLLVTALDVTEATQLEAQYRQAQKMEAIGRLAGGVAHDFNNMLGVIIGHAELARDRLDQIAAVNNHLNQIFTTANRAAMLTRQLLAFSRQQVSQPSVLDLNSIVGSLASMLQHLLGEDIKLVVSPGTSLHCVRADVGQIEQVLMNLAVNAREAMPEGGTLIIQTSNTELDEIFAHQHPSVRPGSYVLLSVSDTGWGIDASVMPHIFEPFFTTKASAGALA